MKTIFLPLALCILVLATGCNVLSEGCIIDCTDAPNICEGTTFDGGCDEICVGTKDCSDAPPYPSENTADRYNFKCELTIKQLDGVIFLQAGTCSTKGDYSTCTDTSTVEPQRSSLQIVDPTTGNALASTRFTIHEGVETPIDIEACVPSVFELRIYDESGNIDDSYTRDWRYE